MENTLIYVCYLHRLYYCYLQSTYGLAPFRVKNEFVIGKSCISRRFGGTRGQGHLSPPPSWILSDQLTLSKSEEPTMNTYCSPLPLDFQTFRHSVAASRAESLSFFFLPPYSLTIYREHSTIQYTSRIVGVLWVLR